MHIIVLVITLLSYYVNGDCSYNILYKEHISEKNAPTKYPDNTPLALLSISDVFSDGK